MYKATVPDLPSLERFPVLLRQHIANKYIQWLDLKPVFEEATQCDDV